MITIAIRRRYDYDPTTTYSQYLRRIAYITIATLLRYHDAFDYDGSDRNYDLRSIRLRYDYDMTMTKN